MFNNKNYSILTGTNTKKQNNDSFLTNLSKERERQNNAIGVSSSSFGNGGTFKADNQYKSPLSDVKIKEPKNSQPWIYHNIKPKDYVTKRYSYEKQNPSNETKALQTSLNNFGYVGKDNKPLKVDGAYGPNTDHAFNNAWKNNEQVIKNNEQAKKISELQSLVNAAYAPLMEKAETRKWNMPKEEIETAQNFLNDFGYTDWQGNKLKVNGVLDSKTRGALEKHIQDGTPTQATLNMQKWLNEKGITDADGKVLKPDGKLGVKTDGAVHKGIKLWGGINEKDLEPVRWNTDNSISEILAKRNFDNAFVGEKYSIPIEKEVTTLSVDSKNNEEKQLLLKNGTQNYSLQSENEESTNNSTPQDNYTGSQMLFETPDLAALDFAMRYNEESINYPTDIDPTATIRHGGMEFGSKIYSVETENGTMYGYTAPKLADGNTNNHSVSLYDVKVPDGAEPYAYIHTHAATGRDDMSPDDVAYINANSLKAGYLVSPAGLIHKHFKDEKNSSLLEEYAVYANEDSNTFKKKFGINNRGTYDQKYESTKEFHKAYTDLKNKLIWDLLKKNYNEVEPEEIVKQYINSGYSLGDTIKALDNISKK